MQSKEVAQATAATNASAQCQDTPSLQLKVRVTGLSRGSKMQYVQWDSRHQSAQLTSRKSPEHKKLETPGFGGLSISAKRERGDSEMTVVPVAISSRAAPSQCIQSLIEFALAHDFYSHKIPARAQAHRSHSGKSDGSPTGPADSSGTTAGSARP